MEIYMTHEVKIIERLKTEQMLSAEELDCLLATEDTEAVERLKAEARTAAQAVYGKQIYIRGLIEFTNYCKNDCYYCGIRRSNPNAKRYRLTEDEILACCENGYELGFRTFVLQGGEDPYYNDDRMVDIVKKIRAGYPDCAITLSIGEKSYESYKRFREAGADRYLLRHETANDAHYRKLHPEEMSLTVRKQCLYDLKALGYQVGAGFMVGSPEQTAETLADDLVFLKELEPQMVGIGPFIPHHVCRGAIRKCSADLIFTVSDPYHAAACIASGNNGTWNSRSIRKRERIAAWRKCRNAKPVTGEKPQTV